MTLSIAIDQDLKLFYNRFAGILALEDMKSVITQAHQMMPALDNLKSIIDLREAELDMRFKETTELAHFLLSNFDKFVMPRAIIAEDSLSTALSMLMTQQLKDKLTFEVFSTWEGACRFLEVDPEKARHLLQSDHTVIRP